MAEQRQHGPDCDCTRCTGFQPGNVPARPFEPGNEAGLRHGAYSTVRIGERATELVEELRPLVVRYREHDEPMVRLLAVTWARVEAAATAYEKADDPERLDRLDQSLRSWVRTARTILNDLGMSPRARAALGLDIALQARALNVTDLVAAAAELDEDKPAELEEGEQP